MATERAVLRLSAAIVIMCRKKYPGYPGIFLFVFTFDNCVVVSVQLFGNG